MAPCKRRKDDGAGEANDDDDDESDDDDEDDDEVETRVPPYLARQMSRVAYADIGDADTPLLFGSGHEGIPTSEPHEDLNDPLQKHTQSTHEHFLPRFRPPSG